MLRIRMEIPITVIAATRRKGSLDCVAVRFANGNFAQDDKA